MGVARTWWVSGALLVGCAGSGKIGIEGSDATRPPTTSTGYSTTTTTGTPAEVCVAECGDGVLECAEECDDGGLQGDDGCDPGCRFEAPAGCGDGDVDLAAGEQCDDGNGTLGDGCDDRCRIEAPAGCGDGLLDLGSGEQCDDGNAWSGDGCSLTCQYEPVGIAGCGDDYVLGLEVCDDGNPTNGDGCNPTCNLTTWTELYVGTPGVQGNIDANYSNARLGGFGVLTADQDYLYYADNANRTIRRIEIDTGIVLTIAGDGTQGANDAIHGLYAAFGSVEALATDGQTLWVADEANHTIRTVDLSCADPTGECFRVRTVAGDGSGVHADGSGLAAGFGGLRGLTWYDGIVYLLDENNGLVRAFDPVSGAVTTLAGQVGNPGYVDGFGTAARFVSPRYMASNNSGLLYIADTNGANVRVYNTVTTEVTTFVGDGTAGYVDATGTAARIDRPRGMTSDGTSLYFVEFDADTVRQAVLATGVVTTLAGGGGACYPSDCPGYLENVGTFALFDAPSSVVFHWPTNALYVVDSGNFVIRRIR